MAKMNPKMLEHMQEQANQNTVKDQIDHPDHYGGDTPYEAIKVIEAWGLGFHLGNALKYIRRRYRKGDTIENLEKARWYIDRKIEQLKRRVE